MKIVFFGLSITSAWGNGHATLLRGLFRALQAKGHDVHFFERNVPYYVNHRDTADLSYVKLHLYDSWSEVVDFARRILLDAEAAVVTSYCPDGASASELVLASRSSCRTVFYDMDTPITLNRLEGGEKVTYMPARGLADFQLVLSYTGGEALKRLKSQLGASCTSTLYGWVDPTVHHRVQADPRYVSDFSYLGTYSEDRQLMLTELLLRPAACHPECAFLIAGAMYPDMRAWPDNVRYFEHISPPEHARFYSSSRLTLNVTRGVMSAMGYCPSGRLFEAAACGTPVLSDWWEGLDHFFEPGSEILVGRTAKESVAALSLDRQILVEVGVRAKERTLDCHTATVRAERFVRLIEDPRNDDDAKNVSFGVKPVNA